MPASATIHLDPLTVFFSVVAITGELAAMATDASSSNNSTSAQPTSATDKKEPSWTELQQLLLTELVDNQTYTATLGARGDPKDVTPLGGYLSIPGIKYRHKGSRSSEAQQFQRGYLVTRLILPKH